jgi:formylglycine-generating enzyme required for sulfatase activity
VSDFGLARAVDDVSLTRPGLLAGTPLYMSPEQAQGEPVDARSDLFSLGSVLYQLCAGRPPFEADSTLAILKRVCEMDPRPLREVNPEIPAWLEAVIFRLLEKDPAQRFQSAAEVAEALEYPRTDPRPAERKIREGPAEALPPRHGPPRLRWWVAVGVGLLLAGMGGAAAWCMKGWFGPPPHPERVVRQHPAGPLPPTFSNRFGMELVRIPRGKFWMGGGNGMPGGDEVEIDHDFYLGKYEITQGQWESVMGSNPSYFSRQGEGKDAVEEVSDEELKRLPVEGVSADAIAYFLQQLNKEETATGWLYTLPTTEEWEYACRGGPMSEPSDSAFDFYLSQPGHQLAGDQASFGHPKGLKRTCPVGRYPPNRLGLHDMHGNVWELCAPSEPVPHGKASPILRGGSWETPSRSCTASASRVVLPTFQTNGTGLRVARVFVGQPSP